VPGEPSSKPPTRWGGGKGVKKILLGGEKLRVGAPPPSIQLCEDKEKEGHREIAGSADSLGGLPLTGLSCTLRAPARAVGGMSAANSPSRRSPGATPFIMAPAEPGGHGLIERFLNKLESRSPTLLRGLRGFERLLSRKKYMI